MSTVGTVVFLKQPQSEPAPVGTQVELTCEVAAGYRMLWSIRLPGETLLVTIETARLYDALRSRGIVAKNSTAKNPNVPLIINGTEDNNKTSVRCIALDLSDPLSRINGDIITVIFYGKARALSNYIANYYCDY